ncbi:ligand-gated channel protein [Marinobacterium sp. YM272]|uniref:ligand-gated channel protein n=1 Tax=Marinobacterium sp. YM272 TaxID=3421654 RepID=UPI003D7F3D3C
MPVPQNTRDAMPFSGLALAVGLAMTAATANADESIQLDDLVVTASGFEQEITTAPASISVISSEELETRAYTDLTDALRSTPGVTVTGGGAGDNGVDISLRGMPASYTLLLVDGKRVSGRESRPNGSAGFETDWLPPLESIQRIEVVRGPMSTLYGSDAIGGVINVITRKVQDEWHGNLQQDVTLQENQDSGNQYQTSFNLAGPLVEDRAGLQIYGRIYNREEDQIENGYEEKELQNFTARLSLTPTDSQEFLIEGGITDQERTSLMGASAPQTGCRGGCTDSYTEHTNKHFSLAHTGRWEFGTTDSYIQRETTRDKSRQIEISNTNAKTSLVAPIGYDHRLTLGASFEKEELDDQTTNRISERTRIENSRWALFTEDEWMLTDKLILTGGARLDNDENYGDHISPRVYAVYQLAPQWTVKGGIAGGYRAPNLREITPDWGQVSRGGNVYGNPDLEAETSLNKEIALYYNGFNAVDASLTLFHNSFDDKITRITCPTSICTDGANQFGADPTYRVNVDEAVTRGVEISLDMALTDRLDLSTTYTYTDSEQKTGEYKGEPLTQLPRHLFSANLDWQASDTLTHWTRLTYRGRESQPVSGPSQDAIVAPSSTQLDTGLGYQLNAQASLKAGIYNLFDEEIGYDEYGYVADGRRYWMALNINF